MTLYCVRFLFILNILGRAGRYKSLPHTKLMSPPVTTESESACGSKAAPKFHKYTMDQLELGRLSNLYNSPGGPGPSPCPNMLGGGNWQSTRIAEHRGTKNIRNSKNSKFDHDSPNLAQVLKLVRRRRPLVTVKINCTYL